MGLTVDCRMLVRGTYNYRANPVFSSGKTRLISVKYNIEKASLCVSYKFGIRYKIEIYI